MTIDELDKENIRQRLINHQLEAKSERWRASLVAHVLKSSLPTAGKRKEKKKKKNLGSSSVLEYSNSKALE